MTITPITGPGTPYITPELLTNAPTGISWSTIPFRNATSEEQLAEQLNICQRATSMIDTACNNVLRATVNTETLWGPDYRVTVQNGTGLGRMIMSRWPVTKVLSGRFSWAVNFPPQWVDVAADQFSPEVPPIGIYGSSSPSDSGMGGQAILVAPFFVTWWGGRRGTRIEVTYVNGWPHTSLTAVSLAGDTTVQVDDCTGWSPPDASTPGAMGVFKDGATQEAATVTASSVESGPGTLTLDRPLTYGHQPGVLYTTLPENIQWAAILFCVAEALSRGATATTVQTTPGTGINTGGGVKALQDEARVLCRPFTRTI